MVMVVGLGNGGGNDGNRHCVSEDHICRRN